MSILYYLVGSSFRRLTVRMVLYGGLSLPASVASGCRIWHRFPDDD